MLWYWETVIEPLLDAADAGVVVEVGSWRGETTEKLLDWAAPRRARVHAIDPRPRFDVAEMQEEYPESFVFHHELSVDALPKIAKPEVALLDGDHNWYTVVNELRLLAGASRAGRFPLTLLHDIGWPYGRRDLYYDPDAIPAAHRKTHAASGLFPGEPEPQEGKGLNRHLENAIRENGPENGVMTAVEDFLAETDRKLEFRAIPGIHGLGILVPRARMRANRPLRETIKRLSSTEFLDDQCRRLEEERVREKVNGLEFQRLTTQKKKALEARRKERQELQARLAAGKRGLEALRSESRNLQEQLAASDRDVKSLRTERAAQVRKLADSESSLDGLHAEASSLHVECARTADELAERVRDLEELRTERDALVADSEKEGALRAELEARAEQAEVTVERLSSERQAISMQLREVTSTAERATGVSRELSDELDRRRREEQGLRATNEELAIERDELLEKNAALTSRVSELESLERALRDQTERREAEHRTLGLEYAEVRDERDRLLERSSSLAVRAAELEHGAAELIGLREEHQAVIAALKDREAELRRASRALGRSRQALARVTEEADRAAEEIASASRSRSWRFGHASMRLLSRLRWRRTYGTDSLDQAASRVDVLRRLGSADDGYRPSALPELPASSDPGDSASHLVDPDLHGDLTMPAREGATAAAELARLEAREEQSHRPDGRRLVNIPELQVSEPDLAARVTDSLRLAGGNGGHEAAANAEIAEGVLAAFRSRLYRRWIDEAHEANRRHADLVGDGESRNGRARVMVGTLESGERELELCKQSIEAQDHPRIEHLILSGLPKKEAVATLMESFLASDFEFLVKLDADMVLLDQDFVTRAVRLLQGNPDLDLAQIAILDFFTGGPMQGINVYRNGFAWQSGGHDDLFTDRTLVDVGRRTVVGGPFMRSAIHSPNPSPFQAFHFGAHRGLKISQPERSDPDDSQAMEQLSYLERTWDHFKMRRDPRLALACLGYELALAGEFGISDLDYTNPSMRSTFEPYEGLSATEVEDLVESHRRKPVQAPRTQRLRDSRREIHWQSAASVRSVLILLPHFGVFGGVNRQFELAEQLSRQGVDAVVTRPDVSPNGLPGERPDYPDVSVIGFKEALGRSWDVVLCADCTGGVLLTMPLFRSRRSAVYLFNGWMYRTANMEQIRAVEPDLVLANSSYSARFYEDLAPMVVPGAIDLDVFHPPRNGAGPHERGEVVRIVAYPGRQRPIKRFEDTLEACRLLTTAGVEVELNVYDQDQLVPNVPFAFRHHGALERDQIRELMGEMDLMISAEEDAGWSNPTAEAMACGVPVVCTEAGTSDLATDGETALVVPFRSPEQIAAAARRLIDDPALAVALRDRALLRVRDYDWPKVAGRLLDAFADAPAHPWRRAAVDRRAVKRVAAL